MPDYRETVEKLEKAHKELCEAVQRQWGGGHALQISIPARPEHDTDLIIGMALRDALTLLTEQEAELATLRAENAELRLSHARIHMGARRALSFGRQATPQTLERMLERRDEMLRQIVGACEDAGVTPPSILREQEARR